MSKSLVDLAPRHAVREKNTSIKDINKVKQGRFNEGFNAEPIAFCICILYFAFCILYFAFCISNLNFPPKVQNFSDSNI